ncbi:hypothetical protein VNO78_00440 [Psophocarpus tetragonolobus]|uniref:Uncharacterized protein n=1 Tax=Psophocarpus tetragonolobus TaxID=3891 RepID=A0AAN9T0G4_PSOTE
MGGTGVAAKGSSGLPETVFWVLGFALWVIQPTARGGGPKGKTMPISTLDIVIISSVAQTDHKIVASDKYLYEMKLMPTYDTTPKGFF